MPKLKMAVQLLVQTGIGLALTLLLKVQIAAMPTRVMAAKTTNFDFVLSFFMFLILSKWVARLYDWTLDSTVPT